MRELKKIFIKILVLLVDISLFGYETAKKIVLPGRQKRGNLLFSLFIFFVGLVEKMDNFEHGIFRMADLFRKKYVRQSLLIIAGFLFLLSSFEWSSEHSRNFIRTVTPTEQNSTSTEQNISAQEIQFAVLSKIPHFKNQFSKPENFFLTDFKPPAPVKTYLFLQVIRI